MLAVETFEEEPDITLRLTSSISVVNGGAAEERRSMLVLSRQA
jgi:hypothetical protein